MNYNTLHISIENNEEEQATMNTILCCINEGNSFVFDAGAGAGKTYALVQSLNHIIVQFGVELKQHNQKALCITYTNVAANEIKERLGNTSLIQVSTIHNFIWEIISPHQKQLVQLHLSKLNSEVSDIVSNLKHENWASKYNELSEDSKSKLLYLMIKKKDIYYKFKGSNANEFKTQFLDINNAFPNILSNVSNFKKIIDCVFKLSSYNEAIIRITNDDKKYKKINYDSRFNNDKLASMLISHDTLLEYTEKIIEEKPILRQIIIDKFPYILVDEYQDTDPRTINVLNNIEKYSKEIKHNCMIGYYGDIKQNIYATGVGDDFIKFHPNLKRIKKEFNRRSASIIIDTANAIRNDDLKQKTIYSDFPQGSMKFFNINMNRSEFIEKHVKEWNISSKNKLHCFELTNELVAEYSGFGSIYNFFKDSNWYKIGKRYELLRDHILSLDTTKLGIIQSLIFRILDFKHKINDNETMISDIITFTKTDTINIIHLRNLISKLKTIQAGTLYDFIIRLFENYNFDDLNYDKCIDQVIGENLKSIDEFKSFILDELYLFNSDDNISDEDLILFKQKIDEFLKIDMSIFELWYKFVVDKSDGDTIFHTYHGTKGREFDNVIIFMNSKFGRDNLYFHRLFEVLSDKTSNEEKKIAEARNLLYVAITRATKNLSILYFDDLNGTNDQLTSVFGCIKKNLNN